MAVDNKYITVAYKLYTIEDGEEDEEPVEVANQRHPFQFISGFNLVLPAFEVIKCWTYILSSCRYLSRFPCMRS